MNKYEVNMKRFLTNYTSIKVNKHTRYKKNLRASSGVENIREDRGGHDCQETNRGDVVYHVQD